MVDGIMTSNAVTLDPAMLLMDLARRVLHLRPWTFPVVKEGLHEGAVTRPHVVDAWRRQCANSERKE